MEGMQKDLDVINARVDRLKALTEQPAQLFRQLTGALHSLSVDVAIAQHLTKIVGITKKGTIAKRGKAIHKLNKRIDRLEERLAKAVSTLPEKRAASPEVEIVAVKKVKKEPDHGFSFQHAPLFAPRPPNPVPATSFSAPIRPGWGLPPPPLPPPPDSAPVATPGRQLPKGFACAPCQRLGVACNQDAPCQICELSGEVCIYYPCLKGMYCQDQACRSLHAGQQTPWDGLNKFGGNMTAFYMGLHNAILERKRVAKLWEEYATHPPYVIELE